MAAFTAVLYSGVSRVPVSSFNCSSTFCLTMRGVNDLMTERV